MVQVRKTPRSVIGKIREPIKKNIPRGNLNQVLLKLVQKGLPERLVKRGAKITIKRRRADGSEESARAIIKKNR